MAFFPKHEVKGFKFHTRKNLSAKKQRITKYYDKLAKRLLDYLFKYERIPKSMMDKQDIVYQGAAILSNIVERDLGGKRDVLEATISQFCKIKPDKFTPVIWNITDFWMKFYQIQKWLEQRSEYVSDGRVSKEAESIYKSLLQWNPNDHLKKMLLPSIQKSLDNYETFIEILRTIVRARKANSSEAAYWLDYHLGVSRYNIGIIHNWFVWLIPTEMKWTKWNPSPFQLTFSVESSNFYKFMAYNVIGHDHRQGVYSLVKEIRLENRKLRRERRKENPYRDDRK